MNKLSFFIFKLALIISLSLQNSYSMDMSREQKIPSHEISTRCPTCNQLPTIKRQSNKEEYHLYRENFSKENKINFEGLYKHIHYKFKNEGLLLEALYPLLPIGLKRPENKYNQLEFLGDSVLGLIIRERLLQLFPDESRGVHVKLYEALTCNKTLADVYLDNLEVESFLPYPDKEKCEYCNVVEALIGAIYTDAGVSDKGLTEAKKFTLLILNDHVLRDKIKKISEEKKIELRDPILPYLSSTIEDLLASPNFNKLDSKSLLGMILGKTLEDQPQYEISIGKQDEKPIFVVNVTAAQIGNKIIGTGYTQYQAEQNAAREAINFLAKKECFPQREEAVVPINYKNFVVEYCLYKKTTINEIIDQSNTPFNTQIIIGENIMGKGYGSTKREATENAYHSAFEELLKKQGQDSQARESRKLLAKVPNGSSITNANSNRAHLSDKVTHSSSPQPVKNKPMQIGKKSQLLPINKKKPNIPQVKEAKPSPSQKQNLLSKPSNSTGTLKKTLLTPKKLSSTKQKTKIIKLVKKK